MSSAAAVDVAIVAQRKAESLIEYNGGDSLFFRLG